MTTFEVYRFSLWFYKKNARVLGTNARSSHILKTHGFGGAGSGARRAQRHIGGAAHIGFWGAGSVARRARRHTGGAAHILKTSGFGGRTRVRRIYLKRTGFEDERLN